MKPPKLQCYCRACRARRDQIRQSVLECVLLLSPLWFALGWWLGAVMKR
ncbi:MAG TPA: hypothetical protein VFU47_02495 [Armatimonadota bacterium]|nr:hypothetical protein [Armatimonadota bacterium]